MFRALALRQRENQTSDEGPMLEASKRYTILSVLAVTPIFLYFDLYITTINVFSYTQACERDENQMHMYDRVVRYINILKYII